VLEVTGRPSTEDIDALQSPQASAILETLPPTKGKKLIDLFPMVSEDAMDLIKKLLQFNPTKRLSPLEALKHPYVSQFHSEEDEPICKKVIEIPLDDHKYTIKDYRERLYNDIRKRKKELRKHYYYAHHMRYSKYKS
jgi:mitogen-activated protein kinase 15